MNILIVSQYFWPESFSVNNIATFLVSQGHHVDVLTGIPNYPQGVFYEGYGYFQKHHETIKGVNITRVWISPRGKKGGDKRLIINYLSYAFNASFSILQMLNNEYDVTFVYAMSPITQAYPALLLRKIKKVPMCLYVGDLWPDTLFSHGIGGGIIKKLITNKCIAIYKQADYIIVVNNSFTVPVEKYSGGDIKINFIPQAVGDLYAPMKSSSELRIQLKISKDSFVVMSAGNMGFAQSVMTIVMAAKIISGKRDIHFVFVGDGSFKINCEKFCIDNNLSNCHFIGSKKPDEMPKLIADADAMLITLKNQNNYNLTLPGRTQAFMACGKPILCCANGETARVIHESKAGLVCEAENYEALARIILELNDMDGVELEKLAMNGLSYSKKHYDMQTMLKRIEKALIETVLEGKKLSI